MATLIELSASLVVLAATAGGAIGLACLLCDRDEDLDEPLGDLGDREE